jgi:hypothetical protein
VRSWSVAANGTAAREQISDGAIGRADFVARQCDASFVAQILTSEVRFPGKLFPEFQRVEMISAFGTL